MGYALRLCVRLDVAVRCVQGGGGHPLLAWFSGHAVVDWKDSGNTHSACMHTKDEGSRSAVVDTRLSFFVLPSLTHILPSPVFTFQ